MCYGSSDEQRACRSGVLLFRLRTSKHELQNRAACRCYADVFMFGGPEGVQCVKKEDFLKVIPRRKESFRSQGLLSSSVSSVESSRLDSKYTLAKVIWNMRFDRGTSEPILIEITASYILALSDDGLRIAFQIDHQDLSAQLQDLPARTPTR